MSEKNLRKLKRVVYALIVVFILILIGIASISMDLLGIWRVIMISLAFISWGLFFVLGIILVRFTLKSKVKGKLKLFLMLTGIPSIGFLVGVILHNFLSVLEHITILKYLHVAFFLIAVLLCPIGFIIGAIGSIVLFKKKGGRHSSHR